MSHEIGASDGFFAARTGGWHGLGTTFEDYPKRKEAQAIAHPWEVAQEPVYRKMDVFNEETGKTRKQFVEVTGYQANVRDDNATTLGVVKDSYTPVLNDELWDIGEALEKSGDDVMFETGGSLQEGRKVWLLVRLQEPLLVQGDPNGASIPYFALQNSHDGSGAFKGMSTITRIVCANTLRVADMDASARGTEFTFRHTAKVGERIEQAKDALAGWRLSIKAWKEESEVLINKPVSDTNVQIFLEKFIPIPYADLITERTRANLEADRAKWMEAYSSITGEGIKNTAYGLVQASVEHLNWHRSADSIDTRFKRTFLSKDQMVTRAAALAHQAAAETVGSTL